MSKKILIAALAVLGIFSVEAAKIKSMRCIVCNKEIWIDTDQDNDRSYRVGIGAPKEARSGYYCDPAEQPGCQKKVWSWTNVTVSKTKDILLDLHAKGQKNEQQKKIVKNTAAKLKKYFIAAKAQKVPVKQQAAIFNKLISKCNAIDFWTALVQGASMDVIQYYWPEPKTQKMRKMAVLVIQRHNKAQAAADRKANQQIFNTLFTATVDPRSGAPAKQMMSMFMPQGVEIAAKSTITPFAIGRSKKDSSIIFTDGKSFSLDLIKAAAVAGRTDILDYFTKQCGAFTSEINTAVYKSMVEEFGAQEKTMFHANIELKALKEKLSKCDTNFEKRKINNAIARYNSIVKKNDYKVSPGVAEIILSDISASEMRDIIAKVIKDLSSELAGVDLADVLFKSSSSAARGDAAGAFGTVAASIDNRLDKDQLQEFAAVAPAAVFIKTAKALAASKKNIGKKMQWYVNCYNNWKPGTIDRYDIGYVSGKKLGDWEWKAGVTAHNGYTSVGIRQSRRDLNVTRSTKWLSGMIVKSRPGYVTGQKEKTFEWKAGIADVSRPGFISDKKEGTFTLAPGFVLKDGKAVWTAGMKHPRYSGVVSTGKMFYWIPDKNHLWANATSTDLKAIKDYKTLSTGAQQGAVIATGVAVSALR